MTQLNSLTAIGNGLTANDGGGDSLRTGASKINSAWTAIAQAVNALAAAQTAGGVSYPTKADMDADTSRPDGTIALVWNDATAANNQSWIRSSGAWVKATDRLAQILGNGSGFQQAGVGAVVRTFQDKGRDIPFVEDYGAVGDYDYAAKTGTDDTAAIQAAINANTVVRMQAKHYRITAQIVVPAGHKVIGYCSATFAAYDTLDTANNTRITKDNGDTGGNSVFLLGEYAAVEGVVFLAKASEDTNPSSGGSNLIHSAVFPAALGNTSFAVHVADFCSLRHCAFKYFANSAIGNNASAVNVNVVEILFCHFSANKAGIATTLYDSKVFGCTFAHNNWGINGAGQYWEVSCNRFEWNSHEGCYLTGAENRITGNLFDRNGFSGVRLGSAWGSTVVGNYFSRNGAGGAQFAASPVGRWGYSVPGDASYIATSDADSCHIRTDSQRDVIITGNRFRSGKDDSATGVSSPAYVFNIGASSQYVQISGNAGVSTGGGGFGGYEPAYSVASGSPAPGRDYGLVFGELTAAKFYDFGIIAAGGFESTTLTVAGASVGDRVAVGTDRALIGGMFLFGSVTAANVVTVTLFNLSGASQNLASGNLFVKVDSHLNRTSG